MKKISNDDKRLDSRVPIDILLNKYIKGRPYLCRASNLSRRGMLVHRVHEPRSNELTVGLQFRLPGEERVITLAGQIAFQDPATSVDGIQFTNVAPEHQQYIEQYIMQQLE